MRRFDSVWMPLFSFERKSCLRRHVENALALATWLKAEAHFITPETERRNPRIDLSSYDVVRTSGSMINKAVSIAREKESALFLLHTDCFGPFGIFRGMHRKKLEFIENSPVPVLVLPDFRALRRSPVRSILVPMSGERPASRALQMGIDMGNLGRTPVDILHVTSSEPKCECDESVVGRISDQFHHEYPGLVEELLTQGSPFSTPRERLVIRDFCHCYGDITRELQRRLRRTVDTLLILEWKGTLRRGHARKVKLLLRAARGPILLVREEQEPQSHLRIGQRISAR